MKILFICQQYIHSARWINQLKNSGHEIFLFDCLDKPIHEDLLWTNYTTNWSKRKVFPIKGEYFLEKKIPLLFEVIEPYLKVTATEKLHELIQQIQPDLVHSLEMQSETYPLLKVRKKLNFNWAYSSWGSDLYLYQNEKAHRGKIKNVLSKLNYLFVDNQRDNLLADKLGFKKNKTGIFPGGGGYKLNKCLPYIKPLVSRNTILIKGYHHWAGRALQVLEALDLLPDVIKKYDIYVYSAHNCVIEKIKELNKKHSIAIEYSSRYKQISHEELMSVFGKSIISIGNSISDGIPNSLLEAIILGAFPIQSNPGNVSEEYIQHGNNGFLISNPEDINEISILITKAVNNNQLLQKAFEKNQQIAKKLDFDLVKKNVLNAYAKIENEL